MAETDEGGRGKKIGSARRIFFFFSSSSSSSSSFSSFSSDRRRLCWLSIAHLGSCYAAGCRVFRFSLSLSLFLSLFPFFSLFSCLIVLPFSCVCVCVSSSVPPFRGMRVPIFFCLVLFFVVFFSVHATTITLTSKVFKCWHQNLVNIVNIVKN